MMLSLKQRAGAGRFAIGCMVALIFGVVVWRFWPFFEYAALPRYIELDEKRFTFEAAVTEKDRGRGLGGRGGLCQACAMLFVFEKPGRHAFWMKDMRFPIDIVWLFGDRVVFVAAGVSPSFPGILNPAVIADRVVEFNAGVAENVDVGEIVRFSR